MRSSAERTRTFQRRECADRYGWQCGIGDRTQRAALERALHHRVKICVAAPRAQAVAQIEFQFAFDALSTKIRRIHGCTEARSESRCYHVRRNPEREKAILVEEFDLVAEL